MQHEAGERIKAQETPPLGWSRRDPQHFALAVELRIVARRHQLEHGGLGFRHVVRDHIPERGVFGAEAPHRNAGRPDLQADARLVPRRRPVEIPDDVIGVVGVGPREVRVQRDTVELHHRVLRAREVHRVLERELAALQFPVAVVPVIAVGTERKDGFLRRHPAGKLACLRLVPGLARHGPGISRAVVLVVEHQEDVVVGGGKPSREGLVGADGDCAGKQSSAGSQPGAQETHELEHRVEEIVGHILEVERDPEKAVLLRGVHELDRDGLARGWCGKQPPEQASVELSGSRVDIAHHGEHARAILLGQSLHHVEHPVVGPDGERRPAGGEERPFADHPVEIGGVRIERGEGVVIPLDDESRDDARPLRVGWQPAQRPARLDRAILLDLEQGGAHGRRRRLSRERRHESQLVGSVCGDRAPRGRQRRNFLRTHGPPGLLQVGQRFRHDEQQREADRDDRGQDADRQRHAPDGAPPLARGIEKDGGREGHGT